MAKHSTALLFLVVGLALQVGATDVLQCLTVGINEVWKRNPNYNEDFYLADLDLTGAKPWDGEHITGLAAVVGPMLDLQMSKAGDIKPSGGDAGTYHVDYYDACGADFHWTFDFGADFTNEYTVSTTADVRLGVEAEARVEFGVFDASLRTSVEVSVSHTTEERNTTTKHYAKGGVGDVLGGQDFQADLWVGFNSMTATWDQAVNVSGSIAGLFKTPMRDGIEFWQVISASVQDAVAAAAVTPAGTAACAGVSVQPGGSVLVRVPMQATGLTGTSAEVRGRFARINCACTAMKDNPACQGGAALQAAAPQETVLYANILPEDLPAAP